MSDETAPAAPAPAPPPSAVDLQKLITDPTHRAEVTAALAEVEAIVAKVEALAARLAALKPA